MAKHKDDPGLRAALAEGIRRYETLTGFARALGTSPQNLGKWVRTPPHWCPAVEYATGIPREQLRPDIYAARPKRSRQAAHASQ